MNSISGFLRTGLPRIVEAALLPTAIFTLVSSRFGLRPAIAASLVYAYAVAANQYRKHGQTSGMLTITCTMLTIRALASVAINSGHFYFGVPVIETLAVGVMFIVSLSSGTPLVIKMAGDLVPGVGTHLAEDRHLVRQLSIVWALVHIGIALTTVWLLGHATLSVFVWVKILNGWTWMGLGGAATFVLTRPVARQTVAGEDVESIGSLSVTPAPAFALAA
jgi:hypothetical protein